MPSLLIKAFFWLLKFLGIGWVYVLSDMKIIRGRRGVFPIIKPVAKIGRKGDADGERVEDICRSVDKVTGKKNGIGMVWVVPCWSPHMVEKIAHAIFNFCRINIYPGSSGEKEWFVSYNASTALAILMIGFDQGATIEMTAATAIVGFVFPWPIDINAVVTIIAAIQFTTVFAFVWAVWSLFSHFVF